MMNMEAVNAAFNEALEEAGGNNGDTFSMEFVKHHEAVLDAKMTRLKWLNQSQNFAFMALLIVLVLGVRKGWIQLDFLTLGNTTLIMLLVAWLLIGLNSVIISQRTRKMMEIEKQLLLIDVYKKVVAQAAVHP